MVRTVLERRGYTVDTAENGEVGLKQSAKLKPDLIISDVGMGDMGGWGFIRALRSLPEMAMVPVIFLTSSSTEGQRIAGSRLASDDYLTKPFRVEELERRVDKALMAVKELRLRAQQQLQKEPSNVGLRGDLFHLGVSSILALMEMEKKSGVLVVRGEKRGRVFVQQGRVLAAMIDGADKAKDAEAIFQMLTWNEGEFHFSYLDVEMEDQVKSSTTHLLMEGARRIDEKP